MEAMAADRAGAGTAIPTIRRTDTLRMACAVAMRPPSMCIMVGRTITPAAIMTASFMLLRRGPAEVMRSNHTVVADTAVGMVAAIVEATHQCP